MPTPFINPPRSYYAPARLLSLGGLLVLSLVLTRLSAVSATPETVRLTQGEIQVEIAVDDPAMLVKFGPRFDRTAYVQSLQFHGQDMLGAGGLPDEFGLKGDGILGYETPLEGPGFVKIGVGRLKRIKDAPYFFSDRYPVLQSYPVTVKATGADTLTVAQDGRDDTLPWHYQYEKTYRLTDGDTLTITYTLTNCGNAPFTFNQYNHNWFRLGGNLVGPACRLQAGFRLVPPEGKSPYVFESQALQPKEQIRASKSFYYETKLTGVTPSENHLRLTVGTPYAVTIAGDFVPELLAVYAQNESFCPEVFYHAEVKSGATVSWSRTYHFAVAPDSALSQAGTPVEMHQP